MAVGRLKDGPERELVARYLDRARAGGRTLGLTGFESVELPESRAARPADRKAEEAAALRARAGDATLVALDERGASLPSDAFAERLGRRRDEGCRALAFVIGGADGLDPALVAQAAETLSFGRMTLPHQLVRIVVAEQLYRATTILSGHPYHRA
nr:23S rRNA (pseudouridine(1915)-N(3))-methyltransferase RlmH [Alsobacter ponti]